MHTTPLQHLDETSYIKSQTDGYTRDEIISVSFRSLDQISKSKKMLQSCELGILWFLNNGYLSIGFEYLNTKLANQRLSR